MKKKYILVILSTLIGVGYVSSSDRYDIPDGFTPFEIEQSIYSKKLPSEQGPIGEPSYVGGFDPNEGGSTETPGGKEAAPIYGELLLLPMLVLYVVYIRFRQKKKIFRGR